MQEKIKKTIPVFIFIVAIAIPLFVSARSGCCSHHGGVCGCGCCDGTSLSATCAPYYPQCSTPKPSVQQPTTSQNTANPQVNNSINSNLLAEMPKENKGDSVWWWVIGISFIGFLVYKFKR